jgi:hypothetical protein
MIRIQQSQIQLDSRHNGIVGLDEPQQKLEFLQPYTYGFQQLFNFLGNRGHFFLIDPALLIPFIMRLPAHIPDKILELILVKPRVPIIVKRDQQILVGLALQQIRVPLLKKLFKLPQINLTY